MLTKNAALVILALGLATAGVVFARNQAPQSCCEVGTECCYPGSPCCTDCCDVGAACCMEGAACCAAHASTLTATENAAKPKCCKQTAVCCPTKHCCVDDE